MNPEIKKGYCYELEKIVEHVKTKGSHPVTKEPMGLKEIFTLKFTRDGKGEIICPVSMKELNEKVKVAAIKNTQNVFSYEVLVNLNKKANFWRDLVNSRATRDNSNF